MSTPVTITVSALVNAPVEKVWDVWFTPEHITQWNAASDDWHTPTATVNLRTGGTFTSRMEAKDGSFGFDFSGTYDVVKTHEHVSITMGDGRKWTVDFTAQGDSTLVTEAFEAESTNPIEMQRGGWQAILDNFKNYTESL
ncbi:uncharacterized protein YndB with AHSA1/START domain [Filimonas zeae]|uniref:Activator of HSP90 ATPase n=1 Tax=Filimonas zeae TaxID=1737353 RepID=A0A917IZI9_9BACT|nr:SRPBCC family protein [Filimonas zeae]MDR6340146.1 uncharacterized protein YndB with AHSA1/START domain [Filimonas zeae]GGH71362.1 activator of HSP90 ATPase [Filimonas zeae]